MGSYCVRNFVQCREMHCAITGPGWTIVDIVAFLVVMNVIQLQQGWGIAWLAFVFVALGDTALHTTGVQVAVFALERFFCYNYERMTDVCFHSPNTAGVRGFEEASLAHGAGERNDGAS
jgi:hypothetical protein